jgi:hypothetical protein
MRRTNSDEVEIMNSVLYSTFGCIVINFYIPLIKGVIWDQHSILMLLMRIVLKICI